MKDPKFDNWLAHGWGIEPRTPRQVLDLISHIALLAKGRTYAWRGQNDAAYGLSSSLYRYLDGRGERVDEELMRRREMEILTEARRWGLGRDLGASATDLHLLAVLQHHGVPTRLVDVTSNPMTALWFATEAHRPDEGRKARRSAGVLFAIDVTDTEWYETFQHAEGFTGDYFSQPLGAAYAQALDNSANPGSVFRVYPALPDERMRAQEGYFIGGAAPARHSVPGILGLNLTRGSAPGSEKLKKLLKSEQGPGRPVSLPFCAIVIPPGVKEKLQDPLKRTYNRRPRVLFPDVDGFRDSFLRRQLD